jgi:hypothetical protein
VGARRQRSRWRIHHGERRPCAAKPGVCGVGSFELPMNWGRRCAPVARHLSRTTSADC